MHSFFSEALLLLLHKDLGSYTGKRREFYCAHANTHFLDSNIQSGQHTWSNI